jgi:hypothetical protein
MAVKEAAGEDAELHGLGFVVWPEMFTVPIASADSSSHSAGERFGYLCRFTRRIGISPLGRLKHHRAAGWEKMSKDYREQLDRCGVTKRDWHDNVLMSVGPGSFAACQCTAAAARQSICGKRYERLIFQACSNWLCWARMLLVIKYGQDDCSFDFFRVRKDLYDLRVLPIDKRNDAILDLMVEVNEGAKA